MERRGTGVCGVFFIFSACLPMENASWNEHVPAEMFKILLKISIKENIAAESVDFCSKFRYNVYPETGAETEQNVDELPQQNNAAEGDLSQRSGRGTVRRRGPDSFRAPSVEALRRQPQHHPPDARGARGGRRLAPRIQSPASGRRHSGAQPRCRPAGRAAADGGKTAGSRLVLLRQLRPADRGAHPRNRTVRGGAQSRTADFHQPARP